MTLAISKRGLREALTGPGCSNRLVVVWPGWRCWAAFAHKCVGWGGGGLMQCCDTAAVPPALIRQAGILLCLLISAVAIGLPFLWVVFPIHMFRCVGLKAGYVWHVNGESVTCPGVRGCQQGMFGM